MKSMIITPKPSDPEVQILIKEFNKRGYEIECFIPSSILVRIGDLSFRKLFNDLEPFGALVRGFGAAITQKIFFRLDILSAMEEYGLRLINSRASLEIASDKFLTSLFLEHHNLPTPRTIVCENPDDAIIAFKYLGGDVVIKPLYGSRGVGITRIRDMGFAENVIYTLGQLNEIFYLQEYIEHGNRDIRILVIDKKAIAGMYRVSDNWKTNIHAGATMKPIDLTKEMKNLAIKAAEVTKTQIAGVDIIETDDGFSILEVNSIPGFTALQKVTETNLAEEMVDYFLKHA